MLETDSKEYLLGLSDALIKVAKKLAWEEVTVKGHLDVDSDIFDVEKISLYRNHDSIEATVSLSDSYLDLENYMREISQRGKLDLANELAS